MSAHDLDARLTAWMAAAAEAEHPPAGVLGDVFDVTRRSPQPRGPWVRPAARTADLWRARGRAGTPLRLLAVAALAVTVAGGALLAGGFPWQPPVDGYIAIEQGEGYPDRRIVLIDEHGITRQFTPPGVADTCPAFSPDGSQIAFLEVRGESAWGWDMELMVAPVDNPAARRAVAPGQVMHQAELEWSPDGRWLMAYPTMFDARGEPIRSERRLFASDGSGSRALPAPLASGSRNPVWSPDGRWISFINPDGLWVTQPDGTGMRRLAAVEGRFRSHDLSWSPDSSRIAFVTNPPDRGVVAFEDGRTDVFVIGVDGTGLRNLTNTANESEYRPAWSPDGTRIAIWAANPGIVDVETGVRSVIPNGEDIAAFAWSSDGDRLAVVRDSPGRTVEILPIETGGPPRVVGRDAAASFCRMLEWQTQQ